MDNNTINWQHFVTRRLAVQVAIAWNYGFGILFNKRYRTGINNTLVYYDGQKTDYFVDKEHLEAYNNDLDELLENPEFVAGMIPEAKEFVEETYEYIKELIKDPDKYSDKELSQLFSKFSGHHANYYTRMWMVFRICERIILRIESMLKEKISDEEKIKEISRVLSIPLKLNDVTNERMGLLKLALKRNDLDNEELRNELDKHNEKYKHIPMFDFDHDPYNLEHFAKELGLIGDPSEELQKIESNLIEREQEYEETLSKINPSQELLDLINMLKKAVFLRDYRDMIRQKLNLSIKVFYQEIGNRIGLNVKEIALLTNKEIEEHLSASAKFNKNEIKKRKDSFLLMQLGDKIVIRSGEVAKEKVLELGLYSATEKTNIIKGRGASPGKKQGIARIVHTNLDFNKVNKGDILIATMTRQDFVPIMRKASAIVTNEGGVTCHAAIISRELGLPCVVGTEIATKVFQDGDLIEVDGTQGLIKKLKNFKKV